MILPIESADAERGFSIMNSIKSERSSKLTATHLEDRMRIRINTNDDISKFSASKYAQQWLRENHLRTDDEKQLRKKSKNADQSINKYLPKLSFL